jgi:hypothetical protein
MPHVYESATTGRSQCRVCGRKIERGELRFGEKRDNAFGEGESTLWFHPVCAAYSRPDQLLELMGTQSVEDAERLRAIAETGAQNPKLPRLKNAERAPTGRATCRQCQQTIDKDAWRIGLVFFEEFRFNPGGFIHAHCVRDYFGTADVFERLQYFNPELSDADLNELKLRSSSPPSPP